MRIVFVLPPTGKSGGMNVIVKHADFLSRSGHSVALASPSHDSRIYRDFLIGAQPTYRQITWMQAERESWDVAIATWWHTVAVLPRLMARVRVFFLQAWEGAFYPFGSQSQTSFKNIFTTSEISVITVANWLSGHVEHLANCRVQRVRTCLNGLDQHFTRVQPRRGIRDRPVVLVEGHGRDARKNVRESVQQLERAGINYRLVGTELSKQPPGRFELSRSRNVPYTRMPDFYLHSDVILKLSDSEGMFGPPLEFMATGGVPIVWNVPGSEEFVVHGKNALVSHMNDFRTPMEQLQSLVNDIALMKSLSEGAVDTASTWRSWEQSSTEFLELIQRLFSDFGDQVDTCPELLYWAREFEHLNLESVPLDGFAPKAFTRRKRWKNLVPTSLVRISRPLRQFVALPRRRNAV